MKKIIMLSLVLALIIAGCSLSKSKTTKEVLGLEEAKAKATEFINTNLMRPGSTATVKEIVEEGDMYKLVIDIGGQDIDSYMTKDGKKFFPQVMDIEEIEKQTEEQAQDSAANVQSGVVATKNDKPQVELFVMSHCPYGTQIEKGILPVIEALGDKIDFELKFCDYAMHDKKEINEQLQQYCIQKETPDKFLAYLKCFLADGDSDRCVNETGLDQSAIDFCVGTADKEYEIMADYADKSTWKGSYPTFNIFASDNKKYGVGGSPTLVVNGAKVSSGRDSASLLGTICSGFNVQPEQCNQSLSSATLSPGFGFGTSGSNTDATCD